MPEKHKAPGRSVSALDAHLGYWLRFVSNHVSHAFSLRLAERGVTVAEWVVLRELYDANAAIPSALAGKIGMTRGAISKLADRLVAKSLIERTANGEDRRYQSLALTRGGRAGARIVRAGRPQRRGILRTSKRRRTRGGRESHARNRASARIARGAAGMNRTTVELVRWMPM
jgi:DNA-binding MarR family transcriptional regulator